MSRAPERHEGRRIRVRTSQKSTLSSVLQYLETRPAPHAPQTPRTPGLQAPPPRSLLSSLPSHGPLGILGKRSYQHHSRAEAAERRGGAIGQDNTGHMAAPVLHNGQSSASSSSLRNSNPVLRKSRPNCVDAPDDSFFLVSRETRKVRRLLSRSQLRRACRQPCEQIGLRRSLQAPSHSPFPAALHPGLRARGPIVIHD
ncbi:hypothetical protein SKAU_G00142620 [Synaphobranchus kaupii]|uniref:Uncharacterized protein n=1 Tax=Synaphobranchus kaupii TaxID=118154 RepID=A0A9Q1FT60_SYNKA|nr:hypothetical protein SKAU_G00142620 [Synaphobranchus kaupii]